jgi:asparagine synthase (glutamine-hydrolysing)
MIERFIHIKKNGDHYNVDGESSCFLGHTIPSTGYQKADGIYAEWIWDGDRLIVRNDRYGFYPLYYFAGKDEIAVSTSLTELIRLGAPTQLDESGLAVFLRLGFFIGEDTPFSAIKLVPPACDFEWRIDHFHVNGQLLVNKPQNLNRDDAIDEFNALFRQAIRRRLPIGRSAVPLSGGRDSRHILLELNAADYRPDICVTLRHLPPRGDGDAESAAQLAAALNIDLTIIRQPESRLQGELRKNVETGFSTMEHGWIVPMADYLQPKVQCLYDGVGGDVLSAGHFLDKERLDFYEAGDFFGLASYLCSIKDSTSNTALKTLLTPTPYRKLNQELAVNHLAKEIERHAEAPNPVAAFFFWNRTRRVAGMSPYGLFNSIPNVFSPFLDRDLYDFLASLPASIFLDHQFHTDTIARAYPQFADIPYEKKNHSVVNRAHYRRFALEVGKYYWAHSSPLIRKSFLLPRLVRCFAQGHESITWLSPLAVYLGQIENLEHHRTPGPNAKFESELEIVSQLGIA